MRGNLPILLVKIGCESQTAFLKMCHILCMVLMQSISPKNASAPNKRKTGRREHF